MTTTSDARKRLAEAECIAHPAVTIPGAVSDAAARVARWVEFDRANHPDRSDDALLGISYGAALLLTRGDLAALVTARKDWEAPLRELVADAREDKRIHDITTARTVGSDHRPCESMARLKFAERLEVLLTPEVPE